MCPSNSNSQSTDFTEEKSDLLCQDLPTRPRTDLGTILVTGATGYIGGRLVPELTARGYRVRAMLRGMPPRAEPIWPGVEMIEAAALDFQQLRRALKGVDTAYYLIHSLMRGTREFGGADLESAIHFREAAAENRVRRIIYLGGLGEVKTLQSPHLQSRIQVAEELSRGRVPVTILRAAIIIGSGSASYEIIHFLVKRLPLLPLPRWTRSRCQPIGVRDAIKYLVGVLEVPETTGMSFDIGGRDVLSYEEMFRTFASILNRKIVFIPGFPVRNIPIFAYLASLLTPVPAPITMSLIKGVRDEVICRDDSIKRHLPFETLSYRESIVRALTREEQDQVYTRWTDSYPPEHELAMKLHELEGLPRFSATASVLSEKSAGDIFRSICMVGGKTGWFNSNWLWRLRGGFDRVLFGVGSQRGRRSQSRLKINDVIDFWRVEDIQADTRLLLRAEMKLPGKAWLDFTIGEQEGRRKVTVEAHYFTDTAFGKIYWYLFLPFHRFIFRDLIQQIEKAS